VLLWVNGGLLMFHSSWMGEEKHNGPGPAHRPLLGPGQYITCRVAAGGNTVCQSQFTQLFWEQPDGNVILLLFNPPIDSVKPLTSLSGEEGELAH
ncbi:hypothetical protein KUCAC02_005906, partial [Chaenocephalus aceratus]